MPNAKIHHRQMNERDRYKLEALFNKNIPVKEIAKELGFSKVTIYAEIKRGAYMHRNHDWTETNIAPIRHKEKPTTLRPIREPTSR